MKQLVNVLDRDETFDEIEARLRTNWAAHHKRFGEVVLRMVNSMESSDRISLIGIERDLIVYAMTRALLTSADGSGVA